MKEESKWTINERQRKRIEEGGLTKFSDEQKEELKTLAKSIEKSLSKG